MSQLTWMLKQVEVVSIIHGRLQSFIYYGCHFKGLEQNQTFLNSVLVEVGGMYEEGEGGVGEGRKRNKGKEVC